MNNPIRKLLNYICPREMVAWHYATKDSWVDVSQFLQDRSKLVSIPYTRTVYNAYGETTLKATVELSRTITRRRYLPLSQKIDYFIDIYFDRLLPTAVGEGQSFTWSYQPHQSIADAINELFKAVIVSSRIGENTKSAYRS